MALRHFHRGGGQLSSRSRPQALTRTYRVNGSMARPLVGKVPSNLQGTDRVRFPFPRSSLPFTSRRNLAPLSTQSPRKPIDISAPACRLTGGLFSIALETRSVKRVSSSHRETLQRRTGNRLLTPSSLCRRTDRCGQYLTPQRPFATAHPFLSNLSTTQSSSKMYTLVESLKNTTITTRRNPFYGLPVELLEEILMTLPMWDWPSIMVCAASNCPDSGSLTSIC